MEGFQLTRKAARTGFDWDSAEGVLEKVREESAELQRLLEGKNASKIEEEIGDLLFAAVNLARFLQVDPEIALKKANSKFVRRFHEMERLAAASGRKFQDVPRPEKESLWESAKQSESALVTRKAGRGR